LNIIIKPPLCSLLRAGPSRLSNVDNTYFYARGYSESGDRHRCYKGSVLSMLVISS